jgi:hypothetical protein
MAQFIQNEDMRAYAAKQRTITLGKLKQKTLGALLLI